MISWFSTNHTSVSLSTASDEYIVAYSTCSEVVWLRKMLERLFDGEIYAIDILCDNQICIKMTKNIMFHDKTRHIEIKYQL